MSRNWRERPEAGSGLALRLTLWAALLLGRSVIRVVLLFVAAYFFLTRTMERDASRKFLQRVQGQRASLPQVFWHFYTFARVTADRIYFLVGRSKNIPLQIHGFELMERIVAQPRGCVMVGSHFGSFEAARNVSLKHEHLAIRMVLDRGVSQQLVERLEALNPEFGKLLIDAGQSSASLGLAIAEVLQAGDWVGLLGDRFRPGDRTVSCDFLGASASFPAGPFAVAAAFKVPVVAVFAAYQHGSYHVHCELLEERMELPRGSRDAALQSAVQRYADRLAHHVRLAPYNWFNFYDFWAEAE